MDHCLRRVAIIGAGPSGLAACKAALEENLVPVVLEKAAGVGGLWRSDNSGQVWESMRTNLSKYTCAFSDSPWPEAAPTFPSATEVCGYLAQYVQDNSLMPHLHFGATVTGLNPSLNSGVAQWKVEWKQQNEDGGEQIKSEVFEFVIVASGIFSKPNRPVLPGSDAFVGQILHSSEYRNPQCFAGQHVLVVGAAFTGADLSVDLSRAATVTVAARRPLWYLPRFIKGLPADLAFYSRAATERGKNSTEEERNSGRHKFFASLVGEMPTGLLAPNPAQDLPFVALTDGFPDAVREGHIASRVASVTGFGENDVIFSDGHREKFDAVLFATGYRLDLPFLSAETLAALGFEAEDWLQPAILHECMWHPGLPGLAFVGIYRGPYFAVMELQARWACGVFSGRLKSPTAEEMNSGLQVERDVRAQVPRPQFPHGDYVSMAEALAKRVGVYPKEILDNPAHPLHKLLYNGPLLPFHYRLSGFNSKFEVAERAIKECELKFPQTAS